MRSKTSRSVLIIGPTYSDLFLRGFSDLPGVGEETHINGYKISAGGMAITAIVLAQLKVPVRLLTVLGNDLFGRGLKKEMAGIGVHPQSIVVSSEVSTNLSMVLPLENDRSFITADMDPQCFHDHIFNGLASILLENYFHAHISFSLLRNNAIREILVSGRRHGLTLSADLGFAEAESWSETDWNILNELDYFLPNHQEALRITGRNTVEEAVRELYSQGPVPLITMGREGVAVYSERDGYRCYLPPEVDIVNTTGAGDSFSGGFIYGLYRGLSFTHSLFTGMACGSAAVSSENSYSSDLDEFTINRLADSIANINVSLSEGVV